MHEFVLVFIPLFVAVDAIGTLPILIGLLENVDAARRRLIILQSVVTAASVACVFILVGQPMLRLLGITPSDFMIAGGVLLFIISMNEILAQNPSHRGADLATMGAVPLGVPLITGPAVLTTCMLLVDQYRRIPTLLALLANVFLAGVMFWFATPISARLGGAGTKVLSKIAHLLLAAIGVMMVRKGIVALLAGLHS